MPTKIPLHPELQKELLDGSKSSVNTQKSIDEVQETINERQPLFRTVKQYPKGVFFVLGNEFCERFSYYGMRAILTMYFITMHNYKESNAKLVFHSFAFVCYFTPIFGAILADGYIGRYRVILYGSIIYCFGHVLLTLGTVLSGIGLIVVHMFGLFVTASATGGIKPCVSAFAADQFPPEMGRELQDFFSFFYFAINAGALMSQLITPILRQNVHCLGKASCFPLAFGVPAAIMFLAAVLFVIGKPFYSISENKDNVIVKVCKCCTYAVRQRIKGKCPQKQHFMQYADDKYDQQLINDIRQVFNVALLYVPMIFFWALFDQQGSTWVLQANRMNGHVGYLTILPGQISVLNPFLIITLVPIFTTVIYPLLHSINFPISPLKRMCAGGILTSLAFVLAGIIQIWINRSMIQLPRNGTSRFFIDNTLSCELIVTGFVSEGWTVSTAVSPGNMAKLDLVGPPHLSTSDSSCGKMLGKLFSNSSLLGIQTSPSKAFYISVIPAISGKQATIVVQHFHLINTKNGVSKLLIAGWINLTNQNISVFFTQQDKIKEKVRLEGDGTSIKITPNLIGSNEYIMELATCSDLGHWSRIPMVAPFKPEMGSITGVTIRPDLQTKFRKLVPPNTISLLWQIPQYVIITIGEILLSITGLEFTYTQAPKTMKSVLQAIWLLTVAFGNVLDMGISGSNLISEPHVEFFVYAGIMMVVMVIFALMARSYQYVESNVNTSVEPHVGQKFETVRNGKVTMGCVSAK